jgi:hypothetical protein
MVNGFNAKGRPRKRWADAIKDTLQQHDLTIIDTRRKERARILKTH